MIAVVTATGTGVGKTHMAVALARALATRGPVVAWKPVESGVTGPLGDDEAALAAVSAVHAPTLRLSAPLSPHLAARRAGLVLDPGALHRQLVDLATAWPTLVVELAGGLCSPLDDEIDHAGWLEALPAGLRPRLRLVLVAPDRLGVLHDVTAALHAAAAHGLSVDAVALSAPAIPDASTGTNAAELSARPMTRGRTIVTVPRAPSTDLAGHPALAALVAALVT